MDVMGGLLLDDGTECKIVTGVDDHSRFCVAAGIVRRAISKSVCEVFAGSLKRYGVPDEVLTDIHSELRPDYLVAGQLTA